MPTPLIVPTDLSGGGVSLPRYRERLADELGFLLETTVSTASGHAEARRVVLAEDFGDDEMGSELVPAGGGYLYVRTGELAGSQTRILNHSEAGYQGSRSAVTLARRLAVPLTVGTVVQVTSPLPVKRYLTIKGLDDIVNEALARVPVVATLTFAGADSNRFALTDYPFLTSEDQILGFADRSYVDDTLAAPRATRRARIDVSATTRYLAFERTYGASETLEVLVTLPADRLVYDGATWGYVDDEPGLHDENDRGAVPEHWVLAFGMVMACRFLERLTTRRTDLDRDAKRDMVGELASRRAHWAVVCRTLYEDEFPRRTDPSAHPSVGVRGHDDVVERLDAPPWGWA